MKFATIALLGILLMGSSPSMQADERSADPAGAGQVAMAFSGGSAYTTLTGGVCIWYPVLLGDLDPLSLFASTNGDSLHPTVDKEHAYLIWVSDFSGTPLTPFTLPPSSPGLLMLQLVSAGTATIYFSNNPLGRDWTTSLAANDRKSWGAPVAKFVRKAGMFQTTDGLSGGMTSSAELVSSKPFKLNGKTFNFKDLIPYGMTCFETGFSLITNTSGDDEAGTCIAIGGKP